MPHLRLAVLAFDLFWFGILGEFDREISECQRFLRLLEATGIFKSEAWVSRLCDRGPGCPPMPCLVKRNVTCHLGNFLAMTLLSGTFSFLCGQLTQFVFVVLAIGPC